MICLPNRAGSCDWLKKARLIEYPKASKPRSPFFAAALRPVPVRRFAREASLGGLDLSRFALMSFALRRFCYYRQPRRLRVIFLPFVHLIPGSCKGSSNEMDHSQRRKSRPGSVPVAYPEFRRPGGRIYFSPAQDGLGEPERWNGLRCAEL